VDAPVAVALDAHPQLAWLGVFVKVGAIVGMTTVVLGALLGQPRILRCGARQNQSGAAWQIETGRVMRLCA
jgi:amino acid transporter